MQDIQALARQIFSNQPFTRHMGAQLTAMGSDHAEITLPIADHVKQQHGFVHGGAISYLADNAMTFAGGLALNGDALTAEFKINYLRPAVGTHLVARAKARSASKRQAVCQCEIYAVDGSEEKLCALAQGMVVPSN